MAVDRQRVTTILTAIVVGLWIVTAVVRLWVEWPEASVLDAAMTPVLGYWFLTKSKNGAAA